ncbi:MAG TPA: helix-turn-helix domain-containing protein [Nitrososphaerales archaeon]|nr:helix-turn-helix domain-containing protein [Nitrososphaerales archaeon]
MATTVEHVPHTATSGCAVERTLSVLKDHWSLLILRELMEKQSRFNELKRSIDGISAKVLSERLKLFTEAGIADKTIYPEVPIKVVYSLTPRGQELSKVIDVIRVWGDKWMPVPGHES